MKTWNQLFIRHGWMLKELEVNVFDCSLETKDNLDFLFESLNKLGTNFSYEDGLLQLPNIVMKEQKWIEVIDFPHRGRGEGLWFQPGVEEPKVRELDSHIVGIVRQLNRLGLYTCGSCDGNDRGTAHIYMNNEKDIATVVELLHALGFMRVRIPEREGNRRISLHLKREELLNVAEKLRYFQDSWLGKGTEFIKEQLFYVLLEELLSVSGASGNEARIREVVKQKLTPHVDYITVDHYGNLLAEKTYRNGQGPTILLNAHLDTVEEFEANRKIMKENGIWSSSEGILGADDRAGIAVLLNIAEYLKSSSFNGKVKFIFTVQEEWGLVGATNVDEYFLWGTDGAIVVDRRGTGDIVVSCRGYIPFCEAEFGQFFEKVAHEQGLNGWGCTNGGSSDTRVWAEHGIQSVNLSAGYENEHTEDEHLDVAACYNVTKLIKGVFENAREFRRVIWGIERQGVVR
jgi:tripeptide aminopeptidase